MFFRNLKAKIIDADDRIVFGPESRIVTTFSAAFGYKHAKRDRENRG